MQQRVCYTLLFLYLCLSDVYGQKTGYQIFENIGLGTEASATSCFLQDNQGLIWIGSNKGLFSYDGYNTQAHFTFNEQSNTRIYCGVMVDNTYLYLGADNGILIYNYKTDRYEAPTVSFPTDVRTLTLQDETLWIGTLNGLYTYHLKKKELQSFDRKRYNTLPHSTIYSIIRAQDNRIYIGTYDGFCHYSPESDTFKRIALPVNLHKNNQFVNSLLEDTTRHCIWIGTEGSLFKYSPSSGKTERVGIFHDNSIKSLALDGDENLLLGTDNGLYVYNEAEPPLHIVHDSRNLQSLSNNIVWNIFTDQERNIWIGTDYDISLSRYNSDFRYTPISQITGTGEGNQFYSLFRDSRNNFWFGGTNGLIRFSSATDKKPAAAWYKMGDKSYPLSHSRIRHIYEDQERQLWIATDGSINRYDYHTQQFIHYNIVDSTGTYNTNWAYHLFEDSRQQLWIATCLGGIFMVNKQKLMQSHNSSYVAEYNFTTRNGLSGMFINQILPDREGNVWVLLYNSGINKIDARTRKVTKILSEEKNPNYILCDQEGFVWVAFRGKVIRIRPQNNEMTTVRFDTFANNEMLSMVEAEGHIWVSTTDGLWIVDKQTMNARRLNLSNKRFTSMYFDQTERYIYLGGVDGFAAISPDILTIKTLDRPVIVTALYINGQPMESGSEESIRYASHIELNYKQNNLSFELSDLPYSLEEKNKFVYRLEGVDRDWNLLKTNTNRFSYSNLSNGNYQLTISKLNTNGQPSENTYTLNIYIHAPWYYTLWAKSFYFLLFLSLVAWTINFFRVKNRLKMERSEKEKILEQSRQKIDFFTNLSHDLKTPLSMIIAPISKLLPEVKNQQEKKQLELVHRNAMKLNSLIHQVLDFNQMDSNSNSLLILSKIEIVSFARNLFSAYEEAGKEKSLTFHFETNREEIYVEVDAIKWESIVGNLLSNAVKYTPQGGEISLTFAYQEETKQLNINIIDTGIGIPRKDIPYIFQRFFQSSRTAGKKEGTGIGLYLVKTYTELHSGSISVVSEENVGTTITITLPQAVLSAMPESTLPESLPLTSSMPHEKQEPIRTSTDDSRPLILIVDDNPEISGFIYDILHDSYRCRIAENGKQGVELCLELHPELIIADVMMPIMNGMEMCQRIKKHVPLSTIPIILLTAKSDKETELESIQLNIDAFIPKPFEPNILLSRVEQLLHSKLTLETKARMEVIATPMAIEAVSYDEKFLSGITQMIEEHISESELNVNAICELSGINNKQIYRKLKQLTGMTPVEYIKSIRMKKAAMLLSQHKFSVAEVMYMVGFSNHSYFSKCFQAEFGKTPKQFIE